jgi:two-component sensor histidine kinase
MPWRAWLPKEAPRPWQSMLLGAALSLAATALALAVQAPLGRVLPFITFFPALIAASAWGGLAGGLTCLALATLAAAAVLLPAGAPRFWAFGAFWLSGGLVVAVAAALADSVRELQARQARLADTQAQLQTLVGELAHRNRNALFVIMSIVSQSARGANSAGEAERIINARLQALLLAQDVVVQSNSGVAHLRPLLDKALEPFGLERFEIATAPDVELESDLAVGLGLLFHELATNALKHGSLSAPAGRVRIAWTLDGELALFTWREVGGPAVAAPAKVGFGSRLLDVALVPQGGRAERRFEADGVVCELRIPAPRDPSRARSLTPSGARFAEAVAADAREAGDAGPLSEGRL